MCDLIVGKNMDTREAGKPFTCKMRSTVRRHDPLRCINDHSFTQNAANRVTRLRSDRNPFLDRWGIEIGLFLQRIVPTQVLQDMCLSRGARIHGHDAIEGTFFAPKSREPNPNAIFNEEVLTTGDGDGALGR